MLMSDVKKRLPFLLVLAAVAVGFFLLNVLTPFYADDFTYYYSFLYTPDHPRIASLSEFFMSQYVHYHIMNGRAVAHALAQLFLLLGKPVFNCINTGAFLLMGWAMQALMTGKRSFSPLLFFFALGGLWFVTPAFGQDFLWLTASGTYLYSVLIILLYLVPFRRALESNAPGGLLRAVLFLPLGLLAGWSQENASAALLVMMVCFFLACRLMGRPLRLWMLTGLVGNLAGLALMLLAPGQSTRLSGSGGLGTFQLWLQRGISITLCARKYLWLPALLFLFFVGWRLKTDGLGSLRTQWRRWLPTMVFLMGSLASAYSMVLSPQFPDRAWSCIVAFTLVTVGNTAALCADLKLPKPLPQAVCVLTLAAVIFTYSQAFQDLSLTHRQYSAREVQIQTALEQGKRELTLAPITGHSKYNCYPPEGDLGLDSAQWPNTSIALFHGLDAIHSMQEEAGNG